MPPVQVSTTQTWPMAKISPPRPRALVSRQRLADSLDTAARAGRVTIVVAPGGSGKTSLLADWARHAPLPVAWYALDTADRDTRRLTRGLCAAMEHALPGAARAAWAALDSGGSEAAAMGLLLGALEGRPLTLVLDDFQHLDDLPEAAALWDHVLRFRPPTLALVILSRSIPLLGFATLAALDELVGLGRHELRFDVAEAAELLSAHGFDAARAAPSVARSGGWAAGVLLLGHTGAGGLRFLRARTDALMEHLGSEVLASLPPELRVFLLESAALGPAAPEDADAILERRDSAALYAEAAARGLFLEYDDGIYRYHDLFGEYLVGTLKSENRSRLRAIRRAASTYWSAHDDLPRALALLAADEDWEMLASALDNERTTLWARGLWGTALTHIEQLPACYRTSRLLSLCGRARVQRGEHAEALALADASMATSKNEGEWLDAAILRTQALMSAGQHEESVQSAESSLVVAQRVGLDAAVTRLREMRGIAYLRVGHLNEGLVDLVAALVSHEEASNSDGEARTLSNLATQLIAAGHAHDAEGYLARASIIRQRANNVPALANVHNIRALLHTLTADYAAAHSEVEHALALAHDISYPLLECAATATLAEVYADEGNAVEAERQGFAAAELAGRLDLPDALNDALRARIAAALIRRDRQAARQLIDEARPLVVTPVDDALLDLYEGTLALRSRAHRRAVEVLRTAATRLEALNRPHQAARARLLRAESFLARRMGRRATTELDRVAELVLPLGCESYLRPAARMARQVLAERRTLRRLHRDARLMLDGLAASVAPSLVLLPITDDGDEGEQETLRVSPFGQGAVEIIGRPLDLHTLPAKARELLFFAVHTGRPLRRDEALEAVWDGDAGAVQAFWDAGRHLRRLLGEGSWSPRGGAYTVRLPIEDDERRFDEAAGVALGAGSVMTRLDTGERALDLFGVGGYLEWCDTLWAATARVRVTSRAVAVALALAGLYDGLERAEDAIDAARRAASFDPFDEAPQLALLRLLAASGQVDEALRAYKDYRRLLRDELEAEPSPELRALAATLRRQP